LYDAKAIWVTAGLGPEPHFQQAGLNLYMSKHLADRWSLLGEVRFMYLPNGGLNPADNTRRLYTVVNDTTEVQRPVRYGGITLERVHTDVEIHQWLALRFGVWLTPYGIWNIDHGAPTVIGIRRPYIVGEVLFPERQTGVLASGSEFVGPFRLSYALGVSNGRGPLDEQRDLDANKAITARAEVEWRGAATVKLGGSYYRGRYTDTAVPTYDLGRGEAVSEILDQYDEQSFGADLQLDWEGVALRAEFARNERLYGKGVRQMTASGGLAPDQRRSGAYALLGYQTGFFGVMPYVEYQNYLIGDQLDLIEIRHIIAYHAGLNIRAWPRITWKAEYVRASFPGAFERVLKDSPLEVVELQLAVAF
jgi:hypothetical protein